jgi:anti-sigma regulatory factor (Ser/Thr protein kinase)
MKPNKRTPPGSGPPASSEPKDRSQKDPHGVESWNTIAEFSLKSEPGNERIAIQKVTEATAGTGLLDQRLEQLKTAVAEATLNAMEHGNRYDPEFDVIIQVRTSEKAISVLITDYGGDLPIPEETYPDLEAKLEGIQSPRGWGIFLIRKMVDEMHILSDGDSHVVELVMFLGENSVQKQAGELAQTARVLERQENWATPVSRLQVKGVPGEAINLNVEGRQLTGLVHGFGQLWQKTYTLRLSGIEVKPQDLIRTWKRKFPEYWPAGNRFYGSGKEITPGDVAVLNLAAPAGIQLSTGIMVIYADEESFSFMTPQGHIFAGMITFSAYDDEGVTVVQIQALVRANDPIFELGSRLGIVHKNEDRFWHDTLLNLARDFGIDGLVQQRNILVDPRVQWGEAKNIWHNAAIRTGIYVLLAPFRWLRNFFKKEK